MRRLSLLSLLALFSLLFAPGVPAPLAGEEKAGAQPPAATPPAVGAEKTYGEAQARPVVHYQKGVYRKTLPNGVEIVVMEDHAKPQVSVRTIIKVGSIYEDQWLGCGLSHYMEHIVSGGSTTTRAEEETDKIMLTLGNNSNASTYYDWTQYWITTDARNYRTAVDLLADQMRNCLFKEQEVTREQRVVQEELLRNKDNLRREAWLLHTANVYRAHPVRVPVIGYQDNINRLTRDDMFAFYREHYAPNNCIVALAGDVDGEEALASIEEKFAGWERKPIRPRALPDEPEQVSLRWTEMEHHAAAECHVLFGVPTCTFYDDDTYPLDLLAFIVGEGQSARLPAKFEFGDRKDKIHLKIGVSSLTPTYVKGHFSVSFETKNYADVERAVWELWDDLQQLKTTPVTDEEVRKAKIQKWQEFYAGRESVEKKSDLVGHNLASMGDPLFDEAYVNRIQQVTPDDIRRMANKYFDRRRLSVTVIKPLGQKRPHDAKAPAVSAKPAYEKLNNGLETLCKYVPDTGTVSLQALFRGGLPWETAENNGVFNLMVDVLARGTKSRPFAKLTGELDALGAGLAPVVTNEYFGLRLDVMKKDLAKGVEILADMLRNPAFEEGDLQFVRERLINHLFPQFENNPSLQSALLLRKTLLPESHPYRMWRRGTPESVKKFSTADLREIWMQFTLPANGVVAAYGDAPVADAQEALRARFGDWTGPMAAPAPAMPDPKRAAPAEAAREMAATVRFNLQYGFSGATVADPDALVLDVIDAATSGSYYPSGWLHDALRGGDKNLVYSVHATNLATPYFGLFAVETDCAPDKGAEVERIVVAQYDRLLKTGFNAEELANAKKELVHVRLEVARETPADEAFAALRDHLFGLGWDYDTKYASLVEKITLDDVNRVARKYFLNPVTVRIVPPAGGAGKPPEPGKPAAPETTAGPAKPAAPPVAEPEKKPAAQPATPPAAGPEKPAAQPTPAPLVPRASPPAAQPLPAPAPAPAPGGAATPAPLPLGPPLVIRLSGVPGNVSYEVGAAKLGDFPAVRTWLQAQKPKPASVTIEFPAALEDEAADLFIELVVLEYPDVKSVKK